MRLDGQFARVDSAEGSTHDYSDLAIEGRSGHDNEKGRTGRR